MSTALKMTLDEYEAMVASAAFLPLWEKRIELINGELRERPLQSPRHHRALIYLSRWSCTHTLLDEVEISVRCPLRILAADSEPEPDICWCRPTTDTTRHPEAEEVLLVIEVADKSLRFDLGEKAAIYAAAGIADYWVVDVADQVIHVLRQPANGAYQDVHRYGRGERIAPLALPQIVLELDGLFAR